MTPDQIDPNIDVIVVGAGNAAMNAALAAKESGASVVMLEAAPESARSGNSAFTGGAFRFVYRTVDDLLAPGARHRRSRSRQYRFRHLHPRAVYRRYRPPHRVALRPGTDRRADLQQLRGGDLARQAWRALPARARGARRSTWTASSSSGAALPAICWAAARSSPRRCIEAVAAAGIRCCTTPRRALSCRTTRRSAACASRITAAITMCAPRPSCWRAAASRAIRRCARAISARTGTSPRCAAPATTPAGATRWRWRSALPSPATGRAATRCNGT